MKQIGRELNIRYVLEGSIQRGGNRMRVNVQLIDAATGAHLWAERFDKPVADLFDMQDEIVARLASQLGTQLVAAEARRAEHTSVPSRTPRNNSNSGAHSLTSSPTSSLPAATLAVIASTASSCVIAKLCLMMSRIGTYGIEPP